MNLSDYVDFVCKKVGQVDAYSRALCTTFVQRRYQVIYDSYPWRDAQKVGSAITVANQNYLPLPDGIQRVISIRYGANFLDPVDATFMVETNPTLFESSGTPKYYEEYADDVSGENRIRFYPAPDSVTSILIVGKRQMPQLMNASDSPIIRNIDDALLAMVEADMLDRQRQREKAKLKVQEAGALMDQARALESQQANKPRQAKNLTVAGNSLAEMRDAVSALTGAWSLDNVILATEFLRRNYQMVYDACFWNETAVLVRLNTDGEQAILPEYVGRAISIRAGSQIWSLVPSDQSLFFSLDTSVFDRTGTPVSFSYLTPVAVKLLPSVNEKLVITSASSADDGVSMFIKGETLGYEVSESPKLPINPTTNTYDVPLTISKPVTVGDVTVMGNTTGTVYQRILAGERERKHMRLWLRPPNAIAIDLLLLGKRKMQPLVTDEDTPLLRDIQNVLINAAASDLFMKLGNKDGAMALKEKSATALKTMIELEQNQGAQESRVIPYVESNNYYGDCCLTKSGLW